MKRKQKAESIFRESIKATKLWFLKLQVMPMAYHKSPADFIVLGSARRYLIECKECNLIFGNNRFDFARLTQLTELESFTHSSGENHAYLFLYFRQKYVAQSYAFLVPIDVIIRMMGNGGKSINLPCLLKQYNAYRLQHKEGSTFDVQTWFM